VNETVAALAAAADSESPRDERARAAAALLRSARAFGWVGIYDVGDGEIALIGADGTTARDEAIHSGATVVGGQRAVVPILGAESGIVIGTLDVENDRVDPFSDDDVAFLEECAAALRPLYD
jgi:putative methionine-R-sulfoxide reductase with GAF domain